MPGKAARLGSRRRFDGPAMPGAVSGSRRGFRPTQNIATLDFGMCPSNPGSAS
jgi:hypothetical protein